MQNPTIWHIPYYVQNAFKKVPNCKARMMVAFYSSRAVQPYKFHKILKCISAPNIGNHNCSIMIITLPLNKSTFATFTKYRTDGMMSLEI